MGRRAEGRRTHRTPRHGGNELTPERSRAWRSTPRPQRARWTTTGIAHLPSAVGARHSSERVPSPGSKKSARTNAPPAPPDLAPLRTRIDDLVEASQRLSPLPATFESLRQRVDALDKGLNALRTEVAAVPKQLEASLNVLKDAKVSRHWPDQVSRPISPGTSAPALFREGKYPASAPVFLTLVQNYPNDARLWYFVALANGLTSGDWTGESERRVRREFRVRTERQAEAAPGHRRPILDVDEGTGERLARGVAQTRGAVARADRCRPTSLWVSGFLNLDRARWR